MGAVRWFAVAVIGLLLAAAVVVAQDPPDLETLETPLRPTVPVSAVRGGTWFCPGGSGPEGMAPADLEVVNAGVEPIVASITAVRSDDAEVESEVAIEVEAGGRAAVSLASLAPDSEWVGAVVEVDAADVVVEQVFAGETGTDRVVCSTRTADRWLVPSGATRTEELGERMVILLFNPFLDDAVVDIAYDADVGVDSLDGVVVPARRLVAIDVTDPDTGVTVASQVSATIDVVSGRLVVSRIQSFDSEDIRGLSVAPATADGAADWLLPTLEQVDGRVDRVTVMNPSATDVAEVDLEIIAEGEAALDPIELTVRPGRAVVVDVSSEARLEALGSYSLFVRSLTGLPVAVVHDSFIDDMDDETTTSDVSSSTGVDAVATRWLVPLGDGSEQTGVIVVDNPSSTAIATVDFRSIDVGGVVDVSTVELGPGARTTLDTTEISGERPIVVVESTVAVAVGRDSSGLTSRAMGPGVIADAAIAIDQAN